MSYFSDLDNTALQRVAQSAARRAYEAGQVVPIEGRTLYRVVRCGKRLAEIVLVEKEIG